MPIIRHLFSLKHVQQTFTIHSYIILMSTYFLYHSDRMDEEFMQNFAMQRYTQVKINLDQQLNLSTIFGQATP